MASRNERSLALVVRDLLVKSELRIEPDKRNLYLETLKEILSEDETGVRKPRTDDTYRYEGVECRDFAKVEKTYMKTDPARGGDDDASVCDAKRKGQFGEVVMLSAWKKDDQGVERCVLDIYYDYTLNHVLQPVTTQGGALIGFARVDTDPLCGQARLRNNLKTWSEKGMDWWTTEHHYETDPDYLVVSPRYRYNLSDPHERELWQTLCKKFYKVHPRTKADNRTIEQQIEDLEAERNTYLDNTTQGGAYPDNYDQSIVDDYQDRIEDLYNKLSQSEQEVGA